MKRAIIAATALLSSTIMSTPASAFTFADGTATIDDPVPAGITDAAAQAVCDAKASAHGTAWTGTLEPGSIDGTITGGPTADGARSAPTNVEPGDGAVQIGESIQVATDPYRIGGSVNMFGMAHVVAAHWDFSQYDFTQPFTWQSTYTFTCNMTEAVPTPAVGVHNWTGPLTAGDPAIEACEGDKNPHVYDDRGANCEWVQTIPAGTEDEPRADEYGTIGPVNEGGTLNGHENHGASIPVDPDQVDLPDRQVVVCISPSTVTKKLPGAWTQKNGYTGTLCTTTWYNTGAVTGSPYTNINSGSNNVVTIPAS
jgi:hypothetical protein